jgi:hypothetical protein
MDASSGIGAAFEPDLNAPAVSILGIPGGEGDVGENVDILTRCWWLGGESIVTALLGGGDEDRRTSSRIGPAILHDLERRRTANARVERKVQVVFPVWR